MCMGMRGLGMDFPDPAGAIFETLKPGMEVELDPGIGYPSSKKKRIVVLAEVKKLSALTTTGIRLMCADGNGIHPTGQTADSTDLNSKAKRIKVRLWQQHRE